MSKQFQNSEKNITRSPRLNLQMQNPYQTIYNDQIGSNFSALKGAKTEKEAQDLVRHLGMLYNTLGVVIKDLVKIISQKFHEEKQQKIQSSSKSKSSDAVIEVTEMPIPVQQQEYQEQVKEKRQQSKKNELQEMMVQNQEPNEQSSKSLQFYGKPNPFKNLHPENHPDNIIETNEKAEGAQNLQKTNVLQDSQKFPSLSEVLRQKIIVQKKVQSPIQKKNKKIENILSDQQNDSNANEVIKGATNISEENKQKYKSQTQFEINNEQKEVKPLRQIQRYQKQQKIHENLQPSKNDDYDKILKQFEYKTFPPQRNTSKPNKVQPTQTKSNNLEKKIHKSAQPKQQMFIKSFPPQNINNVVLTREQTRKINSSKTPKVYQVISLDDDDEQQWLQHTQNKAKKSPQKEQHQQSEDRNKHINNGRSDNQYRSIQNYNNSMKRKYRGQQVGMVCSFCNKFFQSGTKKQNSCQCRRLQSRCYQNEIIAREICLSDQDQ